MAIVLSSNALSKGPIKSLSKISFDIHFNLSDKPVKNHSIASSHAQEETPGSVIANSYCQSLQILGVSIM